MKRFMEENRRYLELLVVTIIILGFFVSIMIRADRVAAAFGGLINVLKPFIYGFVIAYLLKPVVDAVERQYLKNCFIRKSKAAEERRSRLRLL